MARYAPLLALAFVALLSLGSSTTLAAGEDDFNATLSASTRLEVKGKTPRFKLVGANDSYLEVSAGGAFCEEGGQRALHMPSALTAAAPRAAAALAPAAPA